MRPLLALFILGGALIGLQLLCWPIYVYIRNRRPWWAEEAFILLGWIGWCGAASLAIAATILLVRWLF